MIAFTDIIMKIFRRAPFIDYIYDFLNSVLTLSETGGTITTDGNLQTIYIEASPLGVQKFKTFVINLDNMIGGDTIELHFNYRITPGGNLEPEDYDAPTGIDGGLTNEVLKRYELMPNRYGMSITIQRTAGGDNDYDWEIFTES